MKWKETAKWIAFATVLIVLVVIFYAVYVPCVLVRATVALFNPNDFEDFLGDISSFLHDIS